MSENPHPDPARTGDEEAALRALRRFLDVGEDLFLLLDPEGCIRAAGNATRRFLGREPEECLGLEFASLSHPDDRERSQRVFGGWVAQAESVHGQLESRVVCRAGQVRPVSWSATILRDEQGIVTGVGCMAREITQQKRFEMALLESEARHRALLKGVLDPLVTIDLQGIVQSASDSVEPVFGYRPAEIVGRNISFLMPEPHVRLHNSYLENYRATGVTKILGQTREFEVLHKDGTLIVCELSVSRIDIPGQAEPLFTGSFRDIRLRKQAEAALRERESRLSAIFDQEFQLVGLLDLDGNLLDVNRASLQMIGVEPADVIGKFFPDTPWWGVNSRDRQRLIDALPRVRAGEFVRFEAEHCDTDGVVHTIDFSLKPVRDEDGQVVMMIPEGRDITSLRRAVESERQLLRALAEVGESAAVLAHEIKNPITAVNFALKAVADQLGEDSREVIEDLAERMQHLERRLRGTLSFVKPLHLTPTPLETRSLLEDVLSALDGELASLGVQAEIDPLCASVDFSGDLGRLEDVVINLVRNASQAVGDGGRIQLSAREGARGQVELLVDDDGPGIPESQRETLFKPFVTTRAEGTGLGLAICRRIVREHGGRMRVTDSPLGGARFVVRLPLKCREQDA